MYLGSDENRNLPLAFIRADDSTFRYVAASLKHQVAIKKKKASVNDAQFLQLQLDHRHLEYLIEAIVTKPLVLIVEWCESDETL